MPLRNTVSPPTSMPRIRENAETRTARRRRARRPSSSAAGARRRPTAPWNAKPDRLTAAQGGPAGARLRAADGRNADAASPRQHPFHVVDLVEQTGFSRVDRAHEGPRHHPLTPEKKADSRVTPSPRTQGAARGWRRPRLRAAPRALMPEQRERRWWFETRASNRDPARSWDRDRVNADFGNPSERFERMAYAGAAAAARLGGYITASVFSIREGANGKALLADNWQVVLNRKRLGVVQAGVIT
ncbi:hypothetical protein DL764_002878 [Monosporascus ibericus]|uniref:Uncharacterized protein n=1 Tax=Monosporascus ibericus TaxID=155417 RepID=A0A4Q4TMZ1_9PEZI|nr:hypothetical protein DL764_002878 [Monosporascus ibericus]